MNDKKVQISIDDYVFAAINIYVDVIQIFLRILEFLNNNNEKDKKKK